MPDEMGDAALPSEDVVAVRSSCQHGHAGGGLAWTESLYSLVTTTSWPCCSQQHRFLWGLP